MMASEHVRVINRTRLSPHKTIELTEEFAQIDQTPDGFTGITLYDHQRTIIQAMLDIEDKRVCKIVENDKLKLLSMFETSAMVLSEPFGSGKTFEILGLIIMRPVPKAFPVHMNTFTCSTGQYWGTRHAPKQHELCTEITRKFTGSNSLIKPNLIVVGSSVLIQWETAIRDFTTLRVYCISDYYRLQKFYQMYLDGKVNQYDIILLKNGKVTGNFILPDESVEDIPETRGLISVIAAMTRNCCWSRVIYDDFDTISIPDNSTVINSLFTVYVSATTKRGSQATRNAVDYKNITELLRNAAIQLNIVANDSILFGAFNIRNNRQYVEKSTNITCLEIYQYVYNNPDDNYIALMGVMGEADATNIMEMLNGDAIATAAEAMGIKTTSVADIFQRMLDKKYDAYINDQKVLAILAKQHNEVLPKLPLVPNDHYKPNEVEEIGKQISKRHDPHIKHRTLSIIDLIDTMHDDYTLSKEKNGIAINRVIDNVKEGSCQICTLPLEDFDTFIVRCCGIIVCDECGIKGNRIRHQYDYKTKKQNVFGSCANCKSPVYPKTDLIFVDRTFNIEAVLNATGDEEPEPEPEPEVVVVAEPVVVLDAKPEIKNPKVRALVDIITGQTPKNQKKIEPDIPHLLQGKVNLPQDDIKPADRKVIVFANFNETLSLVETHLVEHEIEFMRLGGTHNEKAQTIKKFKTGKTQVLTINSQQHCAGINLEFATDLVLMHCITDKNILGQVFGRIQRLGRNVNARIHIMMYNNEASLI